MWLGIMEVVLFTGLSFFDRKDNNNCSSTKWKDSWEQGNVQNNEHKKNSFFSLVEIVKEKKKREKGGLLK